MTAFLALFLAAAAAAPDYYGFTFPTWWRDAYASAPAAESLERLAATGANAVVIVPTWYMRDARAAEIFRTDATPTDDSLRRVIRQARALGLKVVLKPHVDIPGGKPRALIRPKDLDAWFSAYRRFILPYAAMAAQEGCALFVIGTELFGVSAHPWRWRALIKEARGLYRGPITYAANWYDAAKVVFWGELDYIGIDAYFPLAGGRRKGLLKASWLAYLPGLEALSAAYGKPILFTEFGLAAQKGASRQPWRYDRFGELDLEEQKAYFEAALETFWGRKGFAGLLQWAWEIDPNAGGPADPSMTVQGKPALEVLKAWFRKAPASGLGGLVEQLRSDFPGPGDGRLRVLGAPEFFQGHGPAHMGPGHPGR